MHSAKLSNTGFKIKPKVYEIRKTTNKTTKVQTDHPNDPTNCLKTYHLLLEHTTFCLKTYHLLPQMSWFYPHIHQVFISTLLNRQILHEVRLEINFGFEHILSRENVGVNAEKLARRWICLNATRMQLGAWLLSGLIWGPCRQSNLVWKAFRGADLCEFCVSF